MIHRGEHSEITTVVGETVDSELSGNMIDLCPVGALTSKPFRYSAHLGAVAPQERQPARQHRRQPDGAGQGQQVMRVVPLENEDVNECWIADRDRFSYEALNGDDRLTAPMIKQGGQWKTVDWTPRWSTWPTASRTSRSSTARRPSARAVARHDGRGTAPAGQAGARIWAARTSTTACATPISRHPAPAALRWWPADRRRCRPARVLVVGSFLRKDHPLFAQRIRGRAARKGARSRLRRAADDWLMPVGRAWRRAFGLGFSRWPRVAAAGGGQRACARNRRNGIWRPRRPSPKSLLSAAQSAVLLGNAARSTRKRRSSCSRWRTGSPRRPARSVGFLVRRANSVGAQLVGALPGQAA